MALNTLVSFNRKIIFATNAGILVDMAWGRITYLSTCPEFIPRLMDLMFTAKDLIGLYYKTTESLFLLVVFYLLILLPVSIVGSLVERRMRYAGFGD